MGILKEILPTIATALGGPLAGLAAELVSKALGVPTKDPKALEGILAGMPPDKLIQLKQIESDLKVKLAQLGYESEAKIEEYNARALEAVNATMQVEAASEHWQTYSWRPFIGFTFGLYIASMFMLPLFGVTPVVMSPDLVIAVGGILGVASWFRGQKQLAETKS